MEKILHYPLIEKITENRSQAVYRTRLHDATASVVIKVLKSENPTLTEIARFKQEYERIKEMDFEGIVKTYDVIARQGVFAVVTDDFDGIPMKQVLEQEVFDITSFLEAAICLATALGNLHQMDIIHKNIRSSNILITPSPLKVKLTDFGISNLITRKNDEIYHPNTIKDILPYLSPEQTNRMNRSVDYRTDLYSLGITFYEMLTGEVPFRSNDPLELIHAHIAVKPVPPHKRNPLIPDMISDIVMRLLSKNPEERYQNAFGLLYDLNECLDQFAKKGSIKPFSLAQNDFSKHFMIPHKLYGRKKDIESLIHSFDQILKGGSRLMLITGMEGIGKSSLINEIQKPIIARQGYFISGRYNQFKKEVPYSAIIKALQKLIQQILTESEKRIGDWGKRLMVALGPNGKVVTDILPDLELIIGKQPDIPELEPAQARNRFNLTFEKFVGAFPSSDHPLVLFLDDLQCVDTASLQLIKNILVSLEIHYLFIIGAYREDNVTFTHPINEMLRELSDKQVPFETKMLGPITQEDAIALIVDFLKCTSEKGAELGELVFKKTAGNPYFVNQFLKTLYDEKKIELDQAKGWIWDITGIKQMPVMDNLVNLLISKIERLPSKTRDALKISACIGNWFDLELAAGLLGKTIEESLTDLMPAISEGLLVMSGSSCFFHHDRIQEAAYSLLEDDDKQRHHYQIGRLILKAEPESRNEKIFYIVNQLNLGSACICNSPEKEELVRLNLRAGKKAKASAAFSSALKYLDTGLALLDENSWKAHYELTLDIYTTTIQTTALNKNYDRMATLSNIVIKNARTVSDTITVHRVRMGACSFQDNFQGALSIGFDVLSHMGVHIDPKDPQTAIVEELGLAMAGLADKTDDDLLNQPEMTDPDQLAILKILDALQMSAYLTYPDIFPLISLKSLNHVIRKGNHPLAATAYCFYGVILVAGLGDIKGGYRFGRLALKCIDKFNARELEPPVMFFYNALIRHWSEDPSEVVGSFREEYQKSMDQGELDWAAFSLVLSDLYAITAESEKGLEQMAASMEHHDHIIRRLNSQSPRFYLSVWWQFVLNLLGQNDDPSVLNGKVCIEKKMEAEIIAIKSYTYLGSLYYAKIRLLLLFGKYAEAYDYVKKFDRIKASVQGSITAKAMIYSGSLIRLKLYPNVSPEKQAAFLKKVQEDQDHLLALTKIVPGGLLHHYYLIEAESARIMGDHESAMTHYDQAIDVAGDQGELSSVGLYSLLAAEYFMERGHSKIARLYMTDAYHAYKRWGAEALTRHLKENHPLFIRTSEDTSTINIKQRNELEILPVQKNSVSTGIKSFDIDISTVLKASQAISSEISLNKLLGNLMQIAMENAGADKGFMILESDDGFRIEAEADIGGNIQSVLRSIPVEDHPGLSASIVNYVIRTRKMLLLNDAANVGAFKEDHYVKTHKPKSVLCTPILNQNKLSGILYLENNLSTNTFTTERVEILNILSSPMAMAIDNAKLYQNVIQSEEKYRNILASIQDGYCEVDLDGNCTFVNPAFCKLLGYPESEIVGVNFRKFIDETTAQNAFNVFKKIYNTGENLTDFQFELVRKDKKKIEIETSISLIQDSDGRPIGFRGVSRDITQRKMAERFRIERDAAKKATQAKSEFLANMSHEIRTPMNAVLGYTDLLKKHVHTKEGLSFLRTISSSGRQLITLINDILDLSKIEAGKMDVRFESTKLSSILMDMKHIFFQKSLEKGLEFILEIDPMIPDYLLLDETKIRQVLLNLCGNAVKFTDNGHVRLIAELKGENIEIRVEDTGIGIPPDETDLIFQSFQQQKGLNTAKYGGTGLGLAICKRLVEMMNGDIWVESDPGKGSTFGFILKDIEAGDVVTEDKVAGVDIDAVVFETASVLVVDDVPQNLALISHYLSDTQLTVFEAENGREAIDKAMTFHPDIILMDLKMPVMDGYTATTTIKSNEQLTSIPVVALTASAMKDDEWKIKSAGCDQILHKPIDKEAVIRMLMQYLPFTLKEKKENGTEREDPTTKNQLSPETLTRLPELIQGLRALTVECEQNMESFLGSNLNVFSKKIKHVGSEFEADIILKWGEELGKYTAAYDIEAVNKHLKSFNSLINSLSIQKGFKK